MDTTGTHLVIGMNVVIKNARQVGARYAKLNDVLSKTVEREIEKKTFEKEREIRTVDLSGKVLNVQTGLTRKSINSQVKKKGFNTTGRTGSPMRHLVSHEKGELIEPGMGVGRPFVRGRGKDGRMYFGRSKGRKLAIPLGAIKTKQTKTARHVRVGLAIAQSVRGQFWTRVSKSGKAIVVYQPDKKPFVAAALADSVLLKATWMFRRHTKETAKDLPKRVSKQLDAIIKKSGFNPRAGV